MTPTIICTGCRAAFLANNRAAHPLPQLNASAECWHVFSLLMAMFYRGGSDLFPYRQWAVDAYTLQHPKLISTSGHRAVVLSLATLQLSLTAPSAVSAGPKLHQRMSTVQELPPLIEPEPLNLPATLTVKELVNLSDEHEIINLTHQWAKLARDRWVTSLPAVNAWMIEHDFYMQPSSLMALNPA